MPIGRCQSGGKPGYRFGDSGKCYTYTSGDEASRKRALAQAQAQERAIRARGYRGKETCMDCQSTRLAVEFSGYPKKCCVDVLVPWQVLGEGQKLKCVNCNNMLSSCRVEKDSIIAEEYRNVCAFVLRKQVFPTRDTVDKWLENNMANRRYDRTKDELVEVDVVRETETGWVVVIRPYEWFARGTLKGQLSSIGIIVVTGNLRHDADDRIPTGDELRSTADFVERI